MSAPVRTIDEAVDGLRAAALELQSAVRHVPSDDVTLRELRRVRAVFGELDGVENVVMETLGVNRRPR